MTRAEKPTLSDRDASVLGPLAEHRFLIVPQVAVLLGVTERTAVTRLRALAADRLIHFDPVFHSVPWAATIQARGLRALDSALRTPPRLNYNEYRHDVGVGWLWLAARAGSLGAAKAITTERRMQSQDAAAPSGRAAKWGVGIGTLGSHGQPRRHYPDLMLDLTSGYRVAVELELTSKSSARMAGIMNAYASDASVDHVLYVAANRAIAGRVLESARRAGISQRVHVQLLAHDGIAGAELGRGRTAGINRARARTPRTVER